MVADMDPIGSGGSLKIGSSRGMTAVLATGITLQPDGSISHNVRATRFSHRCGRARKGMPVAADWLSAVKKR